MKQNVVKNQNNTWRWLLLQTILAKNIFSPIAFMVPPITKPIVNLLIPNLLFIQLLSVLDDSLSLFIGTYRIKYRNGCKHDLNGRLKTLHELGQIENYRELDLLRKRRNTLSHEISIGNDAFKSAIKWEELENSIAIVEKELSNLGIIDTSPNYGFYWERSSDMYLNEPNPQKPGVLFTQHYRYGIKEKGEWVILFETAKDYHGLNQ